MPLKNSEVWFRFLDREIGPGPRSIMVHTEPIRLPTGASIVPPPPTPTLPRKGGGRKKNSPLLGGRIGVGGSDAAEIQSSPKDITFLHQIGCPGPQTGQPRASLVFAAALVDEGPESREIRSGDPSQPLIHLEATLQALRKEFSSLPLLALLKPELYQRRCHAWMMGEFLAERDLLLWTDLRHLHPARMADWARNLSECGLASPRAVIQVTERLGVEDLPALTGTGVWLVRPEMGESPERLTIEQV